MSYNKKNLTQIKEKRFAVRVQLHVGCAARRDLKIMKFITLIDIAAPKLKPGRTVDQTARKARTTSSYLIIFAWSVLFVQMRIHMAESLGSTWS